MRSHQVLFLLCLWVACIGVQVAHAQERCGTTQLNAQTIKSPAWQAYEAETRRAYQQSLATSKVTGGERVIPTVVHLIEQLPVPVISDARVQSQIDVLNADFRLLNADTSLIPVEFQSVAANCQIRFCLATIDPNGCQTTGINHVYAPALAIHGIDDEQDLKSYVQWDPHKYLNIWVPVNLKDNLLGYATFPTWLAFAPQNDGVVVNGNNFGRGNGTPVSTYDLGRTATHEIGHWLGLYHTFEGGCSGMSAQNCMFQGDEVCDTPPTSGPMFGCPGQAVNTCHESPIDHNDQTVNYMDYTDDRCMVMFSEGQRDRIFYFLDNDRAQIWSPANLAATGCDGTVSPGCLPVAAFSAAPSNTCAGTSIHFQDHSSGPGTAWQWTFASGTPSTSTQQNPIVTWTQPGTYAVTLRVSNGIGADTLVQSSLVTIAAPRSGPIIEGFEAIANLPLEWYAIDEDLEGTWEINFAAAHSGQQCIVVPNFAALATHTYDDVVSHLVDLSGNVPAELTFSHAYRRRTSFTTDTLQVWATTDCGDTWQKLWEKSGMGLASTGGYAGAAPFVPTANQWENDTVNLQSLAGAQQMRLRFRSIGGASQNIYLDDINLSLLTDARTPKANEVGIRVFPNPATEAPAITLSLGRALALEAQLTDIAGRVAYTWPRQTLPWGENTMEISATAWGKLPAGLYFLKVNGGGQVAVAKIVKAR